MDRSGFQRAFVKFSVGWTILSLLGLAFAVLGIGNKEEAANPQAPPIEARRYPREIDPTNYSHRDMPSGPAPGATDYTVWDRLVLSPNRDVKDQIHEAMRTLRQKGGKEFQLDVIIDCSKRADRLPPTDYVSRYVCVGSFLFGPRSPSGWDEEGGIARIAEHAAVRKYTSP